MLVTGILKCDSANKQGMELDITLISCRQYNIYYALSLLSQILIANDRWAQMRKLTAQRLFTKYAFL